MKIIFQDNSLIVAEKPPSIESEYFVKKFKILVNRGGMTHRLDKDTSGLLVVAKEQKTLENLQQQFRKHTVNKIYTTLVHGKMESGQGRIEAEIARDPRRKQVMKVIPFALGQERGKLREAVTEWEVIQKYKMQNPKCKIILSLLKVAIKTGRTHQIRVHMQYIGHPVLGDPMYNSKESQRASKLLDLKRQFLHATVLGFNHPETGEWVEFRSELPEDLQLVFSKLT